MRRPRPLPDRLSRSASFDRAGAADAHVSSGRLRSRDIVRPYRGVQSLRVPQGVRDRCAAYAVRMRPDDAFSHVTAAVLHGMPVPQALEERIAIDVAAVHPSAAPDTKGVIGHRLRARPHTMELDGLRVCDPAEAWCQLAGTLEVADLVVIADHLLARAADPEAMRSLLRAAIDEPGRYRTARLRQALLLARDRSKSPQESRLRVHLVTAGVPEPELNEAVKDRWGRVLGHGDLVWKEARVVGEYEGDQHRTDKEQWSYDIRRYDAFGAAGWTVIRVPADSLHRGNRAALIERFASALGLRDLD